MYSKSDCEILYPLYKKIGIKNLCNEIDGVFAFLIYETETDNLIVARDIIGVRPAFISNNDNVFAVSSESKALVGICDNFIQFKPMSYLTYTKEEFSINKYLSLEEWFINKKSMNEIDSNYLMQIKDLFIKGINKRLLSDRNIGCLLSGGLDSSLVASILSTELGKMDKKLRTYSVGMKGATDLIAARKVAEYIDSEHHEFIIEEEDALESIKEVIYITETYDTTTIRASVGMYMLSKKIKEMGEDIVIFSGEGSDELLQGYLYFHYSPSEIIGRIESNRLMNNLYMYDVLRADRTTASNGLELRVPFLDKEFMKYIYSLPDNLVRPINGVEKYILRKAFENGNYLPNEILWRTKEAFSDGVSSNENSWHKIIEKYVDKLIKEEHFNNIKNIYEVIPRTKEELFYKLSFDNDYKYQEDNIQDYWMPKWINNSDPSARELKIYKESKNIENTLIFE